MTGLAIGLAFIAMINWKGMLSQLSRVPAAGLMTVFACQPKESEVYFWFCMTIFALLRCSLVNLVKMAGLALQVKVSAIQAEYSLVVKTFHPVYPVVAGEAIASQLRLMLLDKCLVFFLVAANAGIRREFTITLLVAVLAGNRGAIKIHLVPVK